MEEKIDAQLDRRLSQLRKQKRQHIADLESMLSDTTEKKRMSLYYWVFFVLHAVCVLEFYCRGNVYKFGMNLGILIWLEKRIYLGWAMPAGLFVLIVSAFG